MNQTHMKSFLQRDKQFLKELFKFDSSAKCKRILNFATDLEINTLIKYFHFVSNGEIHIKKENFENLGKKHMVFIRKRFESKKHVQQILQQSRKFKLQLLTKLTPVFCDILTPLFRE